jgi:hypothetical protein
MFFGLLQFCSARVSELVIVLSDGRSEKNLKIRDLSDFERGQIVDARLYGAFVTKTAT